MTSDDISSSIAFDVLVIEDEPATREVTLEILRCDGLHAEGAANGAEALLLLEQQIGCPSLIIMDLFMPVMDGWDFCREVAAKKDLAEIPIAIVSGSIDLYPLPELKRSAGVFRKPVKMDTLLRAVHVFVTRNDRTRENPGR